jgi:hypothetical protein
MPNAQRRIGGRQFCRDGHCTTAIAVKGSDWLERGAPKWFQAETASSPATLPHHTHLPPRISVT